MATDEEQSQASQDPDVDHHAVKVAEAVQTAWHRARGADRIEVPLSVVAVLAAVPQLDERGHDMSAIMLKWTPDTFNGFAKQVWASVVRGRPETTHLLFPLMSWMFHDPSAELQRQAHDVARAALQAGQVDLTGTARRLEVDLLGTVLTLLRPPAAMKTLGQCYTPSSVAQLMASLVDVGEGRRVLDPAMGTGGLFRSVAQAMRATGRNPASIQWLGCDIDGLAVACATVNSMMWGLGRDIVFHVGDALTQEWEAEALAQREELRQIADEIKRFGPLIRWLKDA